ncbi:hypothetical protein ADL27_42010 [Streptomyces sp. NRRL F-6602]|nr:hypothetical protein ADL27_42010 [Streptomyces sp. NRRL F-6602]
MMEGTAQPVLVLPPTVRAESQRIASGFDQSTFGCVGVVPVWVMYRLYFTIAESATPTAGTLE